MHAFHTPPWGGSQCAADTYREDIIETRCHQQDASDNCYQLMTSALLMYSRWGIPRDSPKPHDVTQSTWHLLTWPHFGQPISIQYLISIWYLIRPHPYGVHKPWYAPCSLHSYSDHQMDNKSHTQPLTSSMSISSSTLCVSVYP